MILSVIIVFVILLGVLYTNPEVSAFFSSIGSRLTGQPIEANVERDVPFYLDVDRYNGMDITLKNAYIRINAGIINAKLSSGDVTAKESFDISGFTGIGTIKEGSIYLKGSGENITFPSATLRIRTDLELNADFSSLEISEMSVNSLSLKRVSGRLQSRNVEATLSSEDVDILAPKGKFIFGDSFVVEGNANKISTSSKIILGG
jgi:hypothetical protein